MSIQSRSEQILQDTIDGVLTNVKDKSRLEHLLVQLNELIIEGGGGSSDYAVDLSMTINSSTFVITAQLINKDGDPIGTPQTIDLPMESVVVGASYDGTNKAIILTLQNGNTTSVPIGDLIYGLQPLIDAQHKLDSDLVDDTNSTNKFVTDSDKTTWNGKQDTLTFDSTPTSESTNPVTSGGVYTALATKQDTISDLATIRSNATAGSEAVTVVQGIDETGNNYIEMKSGKREYLSSIVPTGNIPTGSVGMGFDEGVWTYKSGTKVSDGVEITDSSDPHYQDKKFPFYANGQPLADYTIYGNDGGVGDKTANFFDVNDYSVGGISFITKRITLEPNTTYTMSSECPMYNLGALIAIGNVGESFTTANNGVYPNHAITRTTDSNGELQIGVRTNGGNYSPADYDTMLNEGSTALPYEPFGYKIPVICGGQTTNIYIDSPLDNGDSIDYTTSQVAIPTVDGVDTLICDTTIQPSKVSLTYMGWHSDLDAPAPSGMTYDTLYEGTTASSYPYPLSHPITDYKFIIIAVGYSNFYTNAIVPVAVWSTITGGGNNYDVTVDTAQLRVNASEILPRSANSRIVYGVYGVK